MAANLKNREFAVVLMDLMLPYVGGGDLLAELRTRLDTPVICLSAKSDVDTRVVLSLIHISEPTRLRRISYAVFCLKKKKNKQQIFCIHSLTSF